MTLAIYCEGDTEALALPRLVHYFQKSRLGSDPIKIKILNVKGVGNYVRAIGSNVQIRLDQGDWFVFGLLDFYGIGIPLPKLSATVDNPIEARLKHLEQVIVSRVAEPYRKKFKQHFAVHEVEAWIFADERALSKQLAGARVPSEAHPEELNTGNHPAKRLASLYSKHGQTYIKSVDGPLLLKAGEPELIYDKCPHFRLFIDDVLEACNHDARAAGKKTKGAGKRGQV